MAILTNNFSSINLIFPAFRNRKINSSTFSGHLSFSSTNNNNRNSSTLLACAFSEPENMVNDSCFKHEITTKRAHAYLLAKQRVITASEMDVILQGLNHAEQQFDNGVIPKSDIDSLLLTDIKDIQSPEIPIEEISTYLREWAPDAVDTIVAYIKRLQAALLSLAARNRNTIGLIFFPEDWVPPIPFVLQDRFLEYADLLERDAGRQLHSRLKMNIYKLHLSELADADLPTEWFITPNPSDSNRLMVKAVPDQDIFIELLSSASIMAVHLFHMSEELKSWESELTPGKSFSTEEMSALLKDVQSSVAFDCSLQAYKQSVFESVKKSIRMLQICNAGVQNIISNQEKHGSDPV